MTTLSTIGLLAVLAMAGQEAGAIPRGGPAKPVAAKAADPGAAEEKRLVEAVAEAERNGGDFLSLAGPLEALASHYLYRKRYDEARPLYLRAMAIRERDQGPDHPDVAEVLVGLAMCRMFAKGAEAGPAEPLLRRALGIFEKKDREGPDVAWVLQLLALEHEIHKEYDAAESELTRALAIREKRSGPDSAKVAAVLRELGTLHTMRAGTWTPPDFPDGGLTKPWPERDPEWYGRKAEEFYKRALAIREKIRDPHIAESLYDLGQLAAVRDRPADAVPYLSRWLALHEKNQSPPTRELVHVYDILGQASEEEKDWAGAEQYLAKAQATLLILDKAPSKDVAAILGARARVAIEAGRFDDAEGYLRQRLDREATLIRRDDPELVQARAEMAGSYRDHVDDRRAPILWRRLRILSDRADHQDHHYGLGDVINNYAALLRRTNRSFPEPTREDIDALKKLQDKMPPEAIDLVPGDYIESIAPRLDDSALAHVGRFYDVEKLELIGRAAGVDRVITDAGVAHLADLINLRELSLRGTGITDGGLAHLARLENLEELNLGITRIGDAGLVHLKGLKSLERLWLDATNVTDAGLIHLEALPKLEVLYLNSTRVTEAGVDRLRKARPGIAIEYRHGPGYRPLKDSLPDEPAAPPAAVTPSPAVLKKP